VRLLRRSPDEARRTGHFTGGAAVATDRSNGRGIAYVFFDRLAVAAREGGIDLPVVLAMTIAHEIGHVLLSERHALTGIMQEKLGPADWRRASQGWLAFTPQEAQQIAERLGAPGRTRPSAEVGRSARATVGLPSGPWMPR
jgi:hypothetical protein